ncbi:extracellular solute-binding protein [Cohnella zeiphila]|uniref:Extracellular solute-binding protein n=1 Tax=Cohnella zeiphila TaxID=2761120 RepID=A0A7X0SPH1_9BACL|nr:extracellular solute-binding protein [Cohnella zeiphila]
MALRAGVSVGTVSNVLNGHTNNADLIAKVESAMKELNYRPDANARSLKSTTSNEVALVLPNVVHPDMQTLLHTIELELRERGYNLLLKISQNNPILERICVEQCLEQRVEGIIAYTGSPVEDLLDIVGGTRPIVFIGKRSRQSAMADSILIQYEKALEEAIARLRRQGVSEVGLILEREMMNGSGATEIYGRYYSRPDHIRAVDYGKERGFQAAYELLHRNERMGAIVTGNYLISEGTRKAIRLLRREEVAHITFKEQNWIEDEGNYAATIGVPFRKVAESAVRKLMGAIASPNAYEPITERFEAEYAETVPLLANLDRSRSTGHPLRLAMFDCPAAHSLRMLSELYTRETGTRIELEMLAYNELLDRLYAPESGRGAPDGFMMDIAWIDRLVKDGIARPLGDLISGRDGYFADFVPGMLKEYAMQEDELYGVPFMSGTQLLFFQKDLFENPNLRRQFKRTYGTELLPPATWAEFNLVAEFFTRECNEKSPVKYGYAGVQGANVNTAISFLNRLWAYSSDVFSEDGSVIVNSGNSLSALKNMTKSYQYVPPGAMTTWDDTVASFESGDVAMVVLYDSHAVEINDYTKSKVAGNIGYSLIPGRTPVLGGWSLGVSRSSRNGEAAADFLFWACSNEAAIPGSLLGGSTLRQDYYTIRDLENLYPWKSLLLESYGISRKRRVPPAYRGLERGSDVYNGVVAEEIDKAIRGACSEEEALANMERRLRAMGSGREATAGRES